MKGRLPLLTVLCQPLSRLFARQNTGLYTAATTKTHSHLSFLSFLFFQYKSQCLILSFGQPCEPPIAHVPRVVPALLESFCLLPQHLVSNSILFLTPPLTSGRFPRTRTYELRLPAPTPYLRISAPRFPASHRSISVLHYQPRSRTTSPAYSRLPPFPTRCIRMVRDTPVSERVRIFEDE
jgi:hypothetical protein